MIKKFNIRDYGLPENDACLTCHGVDGCADCGGSGLESEAIKYGLRREAEEIDPEDLEAAAEFYDRLKSNG